MYVCFRHPNIFKLCTKVFTTPPAGCMYMYLMGGSTAACRHGHVRTLAVCIVASYAKSLPYNYIGWWTKPIITIHKIYDESVLILNMK